MREVTLPIWHHDLSPFVFEFGEHHLSWYWLFYPVGFFVVFAFGSCFRTRVGLSLTEWIDCCLIGWLALLVGGRLGYVIFYSPLTYLQNPGSIFKIWQGGMSFHGALLGVIGALFWWTRRHAISSAAVLDVAAVATPLALIFGRLGNFINGELWGRPTDGTWGVIFPHADAVPRHPSPLYEALGEGVLLFFILFALRNRLWRRPYLASSAFLFFYGLIRFLLEFFREPDAQIGYLLGLTLGQYFCLLMIAAAIAMSRKFSHPTRQLEPL